MSNVESQTASLPAQVELQNRLGDQAPAWAIPHLIAAENMDMMMDDARARAKVSHQLEAKMLGVSDLLDKPEADESEMNRTISVQGDTQIHNHWPSPPAAPQAPPTPPPVITNTTPPDTNVPTTTTPTTPAATTKPNWLKPAAIGAACLALGVPAGMLASYWLNKPTTNTTTQTNPPFDFPDINYKAHSLVRDHQE